MVDHPLTTYPQEPTGTSVDRMLVWTTCGLPDSWVRQQLKPICDRWHDHLSPGDPVDSAHLLDHADSDWDLLFLGCPNAEDAGPGGAGAALLARIQRARPLDLVVAVTPALPVEWQMNLMRAGAAETVAMDSDAERLGAVISRLVALAQARRAQIERDKLQLISQLAISVNHEINNPLTGLMGTAELLLLEDRDLTEKMKRDLQTIIKQCHRIQEVTARLKTLRHLRTVPYGAHDQMLDLIGEIPYGEVVAPQTSQHQQFLPTPRILVVDDNPLIIDLIVRLFENRFTIEAAGCASDALNLLERNPFDLVLIDLILPEMNGLELFREIRRQRPRQKAMLTTAYEGDARVEQAIAEGAVGCLYKPFQLEDLESAISEAVKK